MSDSGHAEINTQPMGKYKVTSIKFSVLCAIVLFTSGCASLVQPQNKETVEEAPISPLGNAAYYTNLLANDLFANMAANPQMRFAVTTFVPVDSLTYDASSQHPLMLLGHQLEQGLITEASRRGFITQDFKTTNNILIGKASDRVFSRDIKQLTAIQQVDFFISGTITQQQEGAMVNARIINARNKDVVAAASRFFPAGLFWQREKITLRNGMIYRTGTE